jgi:hypothetical protein
MPSRHHLISLVLLLAFTGAAFAQPASTPDEMYRAWCARCHAEDGTGRVPTPTVKVEPMDFTDCRVTTPEPDADWELVIARGGPAAGLSSEMPGFGDALGPEQIRGLVAHIRSFCGEPEWPHGNLNLPLPVFTEKAFPENELLVRPVVTHRRGEPASLRLRAVYERRVGRRGHAEVGFPFESVSGVSGREVGIGDVSVAGKYVLHASHEPARILTAGLEVVLPTGSESRGGSTMGLEPYLAAGTVWRNVYLQTQFKIEFPAGGLREIVYGVYAGRDLAGVPDTWTLGLELNGVDGDVAVTPQARKGLTRTGALAAAFGIRIPINNRDHQPTRYAGYLLWEYLDPVRPRP